MTAVDVYGNPVPYWPIVGRIQRQRVYVAGPMRGYPEHNYPAFFEAERQLRDLGYDVVNPARLNGSDTEYERCMRRDIAELVTCDAIALLPGWADSRGANMERNIAFDLDMEFIDWES